jgi:hypothetical protein
MKTPTQDRVFTWLRQSQKKKSIRPYRGIEPRSQSALMFRLRASLNHVFRFTIYNINLILPTALGFGVYTASNRNEYQKQKKYVGRGRCVGLTALSPSVSWLSRQSGILNISQPYRPLRPVKGIALLYGQGVCFLWGTNWTVSTATSSQYLAVNSEPII